MYFLFTRFTSSCLPVWSNSFHLSITFRSTQPTDVEHNQLTVMQYLCWFELIALKLHRTDFSDVFKKNIFACFCSNNVIVIVVWWDNLTWTTAAVLKIANIRFRVDFICCLIDRQFCTYCCVWFCFKNRLSDNISSFEVYFVIGGAFNVIIIVNGKFCYSALNSVSSTIQHWIQ